MSDPAKHAEYATAGGYRHKSLDFDDPADVDLVLKLAKKRIPIPREALELAARRVHEHLADDTADHAVYVGHAVTMERVNQLDEHKAAEIKASTTNAMIGKLSAEQLIQLAQELKAQQSLQTPQITQVNIVEDASNAGGA